MIGWVRDFYLFGAASNVRFDGVGGGFGTWTSHMDMDLLIVLVGESTRMGPPLT